MRRSRCGAAGRTACWRSRCCHSSSPRCCCSGTGSGADPDRAPARAGPLLGLAALAVITHPMLDWLNNYGMRWLMPFDGRWSYGDALFIVDPWVWLALGGVLFLRYSREHGGVCAVGWVLAARHVDHAHGAVHSGAITFSVGGGRRGDVCGASSSPGNAARAGCIGEAGACRTRLHRRVYGRRARGERRRPPRSSHNARRAWNRARHERDGRSRGGEPVRGIGRG